MQFYLFGQILFTRQNDDVLCRVLNLRSRELHLKIRFGFSVAASFLFRNGSHKQLLKGAVQMLCKNFLDRIYVYPIPVLGPFLNPLYTHYVPVTNHILMIRFAIRLDL